MDIQQKPQSRFFWVFLLCVLLLIGGALLGLFVLPDLLSSQQVAALSPVTTQSIEPSNSAVQTPTGAPSPSPANSPVMTGTPTAPPTPAPTPINPLDSMSDTVSLAKQSVVTVIAKYGQSETLHSGFIYGNGFIVTTYNGFEKAESYAVLFDGDSIPINAAVVQFDIPSNLLVLSTTRIDLVPVVFSKDMARAGDYVFAVGTPLDVRYQNLVTRGIVCGVGMATDEGEMQYIVTDAATNPGESGGALFSNRGEMIGMLTGKRADAGYDTKGDPIAALGMTFAVPTQSLESVLDTLITGQSVQRASLDMSFIDLTNRQLSALSLVSGVRVTAVKTGGAAQLAGINNGDVIIAFNGVAISNSVILDALIGSAHVGDTVELTRYANGLSESVAITVTNTP